MRLESPIGTDRWRVVEGRCEETLGQLGAKSVDVVITDPPYSPWVHDKGRSGRRILDGDNTFACRARRKSDLGFAPMDSALMATCAKEFARIARRWVLIFCDAELAHDWRTSIAAAGLEYIRTGAWVKLGATPQFTGDRPAPGYDAIVIAHRPRGRKRWNGGGTPAVWTHPIECNRGGNNERLHTTQKPVPLMLELVSLFSEPGELILDPFAGSGTTGVAALRLGRRYLGVEMSAEYAATTRERLTAEASCSSLIAARAGQLPMFGEVQNG